jgi:hypothetical protein
VTLRAGLLALLIAGIVTAVLVITEGSDQANALRLIVIVEGCTLIPLFWWHNATRGGWDRFRFLATASFTLLILGANAAVLEHWGSPIVWYRTPLDLAAFSLLMVAIIDEITEKAQRNMIKNRDFEISKRDWSS